MRPGGRKPDPGIVRILNIIADARAPAARHDREAHAARLEAAFRAAGIDEAGVARLVRLVLQESEGGEHV